MAAAIMSRVNCAPAAVAGPAKPAARGGAGARGARRLALPVVPIASAGASPPPLLTSTPQHETFFLLNHATHLIKSPHVN